MPCRRPAPSRSGQQTLAQCHEVIDLLQRRLAEQQAQIAWLHERVKLDSRTSSKPPSSDGPGSGGNRAQRRASQRKRGAPKGHPGSYRALLPEAEVSAVHDCAPPARCESRRRGDRADCSAGSPPGVRPAAGGARCAGVAAACRRVRALRPALPCCAAAGRAARTDRPTGAGTGRHARHALPSHPDEGPRPSGAGGGPGLQRRGDLAGAWQGGRRAEGSGGRGDGHSGQRAGAAHGRNALPARGIGQLGVGGRAAGARRLQCAALAGALRDPPADRREARRRDRLRPLCRLCPSGSRAAPGLRAHLLRDFARIAERPGTAGRVGRRLLQAGLRAVSLARSQAGARGLRAAAAPGTQRAASRKHPGLSAAPPPLVPTCWRSGRRCGASSATPASSRPTTPPSKRSVPSCSSARSPGPPARAGATTSSRGASPPSRRVAASNENFLDYLHGAVIAWIDKSAPPSLVPAPRTVPYRLSELSCSRGLPRSGRGVNTYLATTPQPCISRFLYSSATHRSGSLTCKLSPRRRCHGSPCGSRRECGGLPPATALHGSLLPRLSRSPHRQIADPVDPLHSAGDRAGLSSGGRRDSLAGVRRSQGRASCTGGACQRPAAIHIGRPASSQSAGRQYETT